MDSAVNNTVNASLALQQVNTEQQAQMSLLKRALDTQVSQVSQLMESMSGETPLATVGALGTQLNTYA